MGIAYRRHEKMSDLAFILMTAVFKIMDFFYSYIKNRIRKLGIRPGMTIVDYGCGPGRYTIPFAERTGERGKVYAIDIHELALAAVRRKAAQKRLNNIETAQARDNDNGIMPVDYRINRQIWSAAWICFSSSEIPENSCRKLSAS